MCINNNISALYIPTGRGNLFAKGIAEIAANTPPVNWALIGWQKKQEKLRLERETAQPIHPETPLDQLTSLDRYYYSQLIKLRDTHTSAWKSINKCAYTLGGLEHLGLDKAKAYEDIARVVGPEFHKYHKTFTKAWEDGINKPYELPETMTDREYQTAMQWVTRIAHLHPHEYEWLLANLGQEIPDEFIEIAATPIKVKDAFISFPADLDTDKGLMWLTRAVTRYEEYRAVRPTLISLVLDETVREASFTRKDTTENYRLYVETIFSRMVINESDTVIYADNSVNLTMKLVHGKTLNKNTMKRFKETLTRSKRVAVVAGRKNYRKESTTYTVDMAGVGGNVYNPQVCTTTYTSLVWVKPYLDAYDDLRDDEKVRHDSEEEFRNQATDLLDEAERILTTYTDDQGHHRASFTKPPLPTEPPLPASRRTLKRKAEQIRLTVTRGNPLP